MSSYAPTDFPGRPVAVIGAGTLGRRIALMFAAHGAQVRIYDLAEAQRDAAVEFVSQNLPALAEGLTGIVPGQVSAEADLARGGALNYQQPGLPVRSRPPSGTHGRTTTNG
jgi:3-hydroxybutyryl-CoA dehydrogenase